MSRRFREDPLERSDERWSRMNDLEIDRQGNEERFATSSPRLVTISPRSSSSSSSSSRVMQSDQKDEEEAEDHDRDRDGEGRGDEGEDRSRSSGGGGEERMMRYETEEELAQHPGSRFCFCCCGVPKTLGRAETRAILDVAYPVMLSNIAFNLMNVMDLAFVGRLGTNPLAAASIGIMFLSCMAFFGVGLCTAVDTIVSQAYGARNYTLMSLTVQRGFLILTVYCLPAIPLCFYAENILIALGQDPEISHLAGQFAIYSIPGIPTYLYYQILRQYLVSQSVMWPIVVTGFSLNFVNFGTNYLLIFGAGSWEGLGFIGAPLATSISRFLIFIIILLICVRIRHKLHWTGFSRRAFEWIGIRKFLAIGIPGGFMVAAEVLGFEITSFFAGWIDATSLAAHVSVMSLVISSFMFPFGLAVGSSVRVGNLLGGRNSHAARSASRAGVTIGIVCMICIGIFLLSTRSVIGRLYSTDDDVVLMVSSIVPIVALFEIFDGIQTVCGGILRGMGRQVIGAAANFLAYYVISLPLGLSLAFVAGWGIMGFWFGLMVGLFVAMAVLSTFLFRTDWEKETLLASARVQDDVQQTSDSSLPSDSMELRPIHRFEGTIEGLSEDGRSLLVYADSEAEKDSDIDIIELRV